MNKYSHALVALVGAVLIALPVQAKKKSTTETPPAEQQQSPSPEQPNASPSLQPFPHYRNFILTEINGKTSPVEIWINIDATGHARGFSGCKTGLQFLLLGPIAWDLNRCPLLMNKNANQHSPPLSETFGIL